MYRNQNRLALKPLVRVEETQKSNEDPLFSVFEKVIVNLKARIMSSQLNSPTQVEKEAYLKLKNVV